MIYSKNKEDKMTFQLVADLIFYLKQFFINIFSNCCLTATSRQETAELVSQDPVELPDVVSDTEEAPPTKEVTEEVKKESPPPKKKPFKPYRGKLKSAGVSKMTESLEESEMNLIYNEVVTSMPQSDDRPSTLLNMPASCTSILKVSLIMLIELRNKMTILH